MHNWLIFISIVVLAFLCAFFIQEISGVVKVWIQADILRRMPLNNKPDERLGQLLGMSNAVYKMR